MFQSYLNYMKNRQNPLDQTNLIYCISVKYDFFIIVFFIFDH